LALLKYPLKKTPDEAWPEAKAVEIPPYQDMDRLGAVPNDASLASYASINWVRF